MNAPRTRVPLLVVLLASTMLAAIPAAGIVAPGLISSNEVDAKSLGADLERSMWKAIADHDMKTVESMLASGFLSVHENGARDRAKELDLISKLKLGPYELSDFVVTREGPTMVVCYFVEVAETIDGDRLPKRRSARSSVWLMTPQGWQWIHHANLNPLPPKA